MRFLKLKGIFELGERPIRKFFEHRMATYAEQLSYRGLFGLFPFIILVFALLAVLQLDAVFDRLIEAAMGAPPQQIPEPLEPVAKESRAQAEFLRPLLEQYRERKTLYVCGFCKPMQGSAATDRTLVMSRSADQTHSSAL